MHTIEVRATGRIPTVTLTEAVIIARVKQSPPADRLAALLRESHAAALRPLQVRELTVQLEFHAKGAHRPCDVCEALAGYVPRIGGAPRVMRL